MLGRQACTSTPSPVGTRMWFGFLPDGDGETIRARSKGLPTRSTPCRSGDGDAGRGRVNLDDLADACATLKERWEFLVVVSPLRIPRHRFAVQPYCRDVVSLPEPTQGTHSSTVKTRQRPDAARI